MRILFVHERFGSLAGAEANIRIVGGALKERGHKVGILHGPGTGKGEQAWSAIFDYSISLEAKPTKDSSILEALQAFQPQVVYVHKMADVDVVERLVQSTLPLVRMVHDHDIYCMRSYKYSYISRKICTRALSPYCVFPCGGFLVRDRNGRFPLQYRSFAQKKKEVALNRRFQRMLVVTEYMKQELLRNGFDESRIAIFPPVPPKGDPTIRSNFSDRNLIVYAGQIIRGKGVDILLRSLALVQCPFECVILGEGNHRPRCEALSRRLGLQDRVHFKGFVPQDVLTTYYRECSAVAISSVWPEPIATIGLEVMRYGLPVVAFDAGGIKDWLLNGRNGFLVPWMDCRRYAERLEILLRDKTLARSMGEQGRRLSDERYSFDRYIDALEELFARVEHEARREDSGKIRRGAATAISS